MLFLYVNFFLQIIYVGNYLSLLLESKKIFPTFAAINSRIMKEVNTAYLTCPIRNVIDRFGDKWSLLVLYHLHKYGTLRFGQIYKEMSDVSEKMLSATLKNLERDGLVRRKAYPEIPPRVEYSLTPLGESLMPHVDSLIGWAVEHFQDVTHGKVLV